ncbi:MAG TPA: alpha/beta fold hydrolase, partial [Candidatus Dormibacteraeota bacterium]|nr:alpha/beta fold hydrolase [Candidatus Dormibacteraeota bacterium]
MTRGPHPSESTVALPSGLRLRVVRWGDPHARPVLCIHGAGAHAYWWQRLAPALLPAHHVIAPDLRGHGASDHAASYLIEDFADDCLALLDLLTAGPVALVGHSMGGRVATWIAANHPRRVRALALLDARLGAVPRERAERWRGAHSGDAPPRHYASRAEAMAAFRLTPTEADVAPAIRTELAARAIRQRPDGRWMMAFDRAVLALDGSRVEDLLPIIASVRCPTLIL